MKSDLPELFRAIIGEYLAADAIRTSGGAERGHPRASPELQNQCCQRLDCEVLNSIAKHAQSCLRPFLRHFFASRRDNGKVSAAWGSADDRDELPPRDRAARNPHDCAKREREARTGNENSENRGIPRHPPNCRTNTANSLMVRCLIQPRITLKLASDRS